MRWCLSCGETRACEGRAEAAHGAAARSFGTRMGLNCAHENTKGRKGAAWGRAPHRRAGVIAGSASADREIAKSQKNNQITEAPAHATAPARPAELIEFVVGSPHARRTEPPGKPTKTNAPNPPRIRSVPADGVFRGFSRFRVFAIVPSPARTLPPRPTHRKPASHRPLSSFRVFVCRSSARCPATPAVPVVTPAAR